MTNLKVVAKLHSSGVTLNLSMNGEFMGKLEMTAVNFGIFLSVLVNGCRSTSDTKLTLEVTDDLTGETHNV